MNESRAHLLREQERGQSLVELAVSMVLIMTLLAGAVDIGRIFYTYVSILDASQEGAVYAAIEPGVDADIIARATNSSTAPIDLRNDPNVSVTVSPVAASRCAGAQATVAVTYNYTFTMPFVGTFVPFASIPITATTSSIILRDDC
ncbi:MAG: pilus assembly protein [Chloroflexi bacterium]|nr:pilus assembly protein [Chloroflexota bacterium]